MADINFPFLIEDFIDVINNNPNSESGHWSLSCYNALKADIRDHYSIIQDDKCCYCKISLRHGGYSEPIEHIVPKSDKPNWMFIPKNLALSCIPCNTKKSAKNTITPNTISGTNYPTNSNDFLIYHPHFDVWDEQIEEYHEFFLMPISDKGRRTFDVCQLYRVGLPLDKVKQKNWQEEPFRIRVIGDVLLDPSIDDGTKKQCEDIVIDIIRRARKKADILNR